MAEAQRYRMTFKCECGNVFKRLTKNPDLVDPPCPECKKKNKKTVFHRLGDGPIPETEQYAETRKPERPAPNTIYQCKDCHAVAKVFEDVGETVLTLCPACDSPELQYRGKISRDIPTSSQTKNKCVDKTADIVMTDYGMTNLKDNVGIGESMAPKLPGHAQTMADNMIGGARKGQNVVWDANKRRPVVVPGNVGRGANLARAALSGAMLDKTRDPVAMLHKAERGGN